ncbi:MULTISPECIES: hypothetical protein [Paenibacillus]|uniref:hypothetical protein n=1 Tax=Paenibacillus TaxID=44249 RepID=UPI000F4F9643|nr:MULTISPECIES: hypothetical protein [Paenibacillus]KAF6650872.1 hypothetical protein HFD99_24200 [Paenibacillus sp. EKM301P]MBE3650251.1 hypothetical protein [Paenibacillus polymyxa]
MAAFGSDGGGGTSRTVCFAKAGTCPAKEVSSANGRLTSLALEAGSFRPACCLSLASLAHRRLYKPPVKNSWHEIVMP